MDITISCNMNDVSLRSSELTRDKVTKKGRVEIGEKGNIRSNKNRKPLRSMCITKA